MRSAQRFTLTVFDSFMDIQRQFVLCVCFEIDEDSVLADLEDR